MPENYVDSTYDIIEIERGNYQDGGLAFLPVAGPAPQPVSLVRLHSGYELHWVTFAMVRRGAPPVVPHPTMFDANLCFLRGWVSFNVPIPQGGGPHIYSGAGLYQYVKQSPTGLAEVTPLGRMPFETSLANTVHDITPDYFSNAFLSPTVPTPLTGVPPLPIGLIGE